MHKLILTLLTTSLLAIAADPFVGVWKPTHLEQWKTSPGMPERNKSNILIVSAKGKDTLHVTCKEATGEIRWEADWVRDGKEIGTDGREFVVKRIKPNHVHTVLTGAKGSVVEEYVVSADGKSLTQTRKGTAASTGRAMDEVYLFAKLP